MADQYPESGFTTNLGLNLEGMAVNLAADLISLDAMFSQGATPTSFVQWNDVNGNVIAAINKNGTIYTKGGLLVPASSGVGLDMMSAYTVPIVHGAVSLLSQTTPLFITGEAEDETLLHLLSFYVDSHLDGGGNPSDNTLSIYMTWTDPSGGPINTIVGVIDGIDPNNRYLYITVPVLPKLGTPINITTVYAGTVNNKHFTYDIAVCKMHLPLNGYTDQFVVTPNSGEVIPTPVITGSFTLGDLISLPSYNFWLSEDATSTSSDKISINAMSLVGNQAALQVALDGGPSADISGLTCLVNGYNGAALRFLVTAAPGSSGGYFYGVEGIAGTNGNTAIHANLYGGYFFAGDFGSGGQVDTTTGLYCEAYGTTGTSTAYGLDIGNIKADTSTGTAIKIHLDSYITGNTKYAIKSDTTAPSVFAGLLATTTLDLSAAAPTTSAGHIAIGGTHAATASVGGGQAVPATVLGYIIANVEGTEVKIPYFAA